VARSALRGVLNFAPKRAALVSQIEKGVREPANRIEIDRFGNCEQGECLFDRNADVTESPAIDEAVRQNTTRISELPASHPGSRRRITGDCYTGP